MADQAENPNGQSRITAQEAAEKPALALAPQQDDRPLNSVDILSGQPQRGPAPLHLEPKGPTQPPIGTAEMVDDNTILLHLRAESLDGNTHGDGELIYHRGDKDFVSISNHVGELHVGEIKFVSPWTDNQSGSDKGQPDNKAKEQSLLPTDSTKTGTATGTATGTSTGTPTDKATGTADGDISQTGKIPVVQDPILPPGQAFVDDVNKTYNSMSVETRNIVTASGAKVTPVNHLTDAMPELKNLSPRGWPTGATWDAVDGCYSAGKKEIIIAEQRQLVATGKWVASGRTDQVLRHETGHDVDFTIKTMSEHADFKQAYDTDFNAIPIADKNQLSYFMQPGVAGREETAAEGVADREGGATGGITFHKDFPNTLKVINDTINISGANNSPIAPITPIVPTNPLTPTVPKTPQP